MTEIVDLKAVRASRERPDPDCLRKDQYGRELKAFAFEYSVGEKSFTFELYAYDFDDAERHLAGIMRTAEMLGELQRSQGY